MATFAKGKRELQQARSKRKLSDIDEKITRINFEKEIRSVVPKELKELKQWINWRIGKVDERVQKIPCNKAGVAINCLESDNQLSYAQAVKNATSEKGKKMKMGIGFVFAGNGISGIDIDHCIDEDGKLSADASKIVEKFDSYTEISPGGDGLHIFVKGELPEIAGEGKKYRGGKFGSYEAYSEGRFFTFTGNVYSGRKKLKKRERALDWFWKEFIRKKSDTKTNHGINKSEKTKSIKEVILRIKKSEDGIRFRALMDGDTSNHKSPSEADFCLACILAEHCDLNHEVIEKVMRKSKLAHRVKWDRKDYLKRTITRAIDNVCTATMPESPLFKVYSAAELEKMEIPEMKWLIPEILPEGLSIIAGKPKVGKSWLALKMALARARGNIFWGKRVEKGTVLYMALEDGAKRLKARLKKLLGEEAFPENLWIADSSQFEAIREGLVKKLTQFLDAHQDVKFVVIDVIAKVSAYKKRNETQYQQEYGFMSLLQNLCTERGICILAIAHLRKAGADDPFDCISGTLGITGGCDTVMVLESSKSKNLSAVLHSVGREVMESKFPLKFKEGNWTKLKGDAEFYGLSSTRRKIIKYLREVGEGSPRDISLKLSLNRNNVRKTLTDMLNDSQVTKSDRGVYSLPKKYK